MCKSVAYVKVVSAYVTVFKVKEERCVPIPGVEPGPPG